MEDDLDRKTTELIQLRRIMLVETEGERETKGLVRERRGEVDTGRQKGDT